MKPGYDVKTNHREFNEVDLVTRINVIPSIYVDCNTAQIKSESGGPESFKCIPKES